MMQNNTSSTEQSILEAAEQLFLDKGFSNTSTTEIAKKVGCNQALVHYYFRTKDKLFEAVFEKKASMFISSFLQISRDNISFEEKLQRKIELHFDILRANPRLPFLMFNELTTNPQRLLSIKEKFKMNNVSILDHFKSELETEIKKGTIRQIEPIDLILMMISLNVVLFIAHPILKILINISDEEYERMIERRKRENVLVILRSLRPL
jgi:TetR/AcrR family transcriptional regulator